MKSIILIDGNSLMHRSYYGVNKGFIPLYEGKPIGMVYGFASTLLHIIEQFRPDGLMVTFDTKEKTFRHEMDADYKAHREKAPDDFYEQIPYVYTLLEHFCIPSLDLPGYESDDIIGTISQKAAKKEYSVKIFSNDHDFLQLVSEKIKLIKFNGGKNLLEYGPEQTFSRYGVSPQQIIDFKALTGDSSDNYKGIEGIGPKTATSLLQKYEHLEGIYEHIHELKPALRKKFEEQKDYLFHCRELATIHTSVPIDFNLSQIFQLCPETTIDFFEKMKFHSLENRYRNLIKKFDQNKKKEQNEDTKKSQEEEQMSLFL
ncbi:hypothetical protein K9M59_04105 [Candidatus Gracilibacteria bacterium]|nr:hypothetical protein [Candidatus Gracilibacteria bacterium]MCF7819505.1 hypothetical protein [Candidatus Gracilibacteria bacterium]